MTPPRLGRFDTVVVELFLLIADTVYDEDEWLSKIEELVADRAPDLDADSVDYDKVEQAVLNDLYIALGKALVSSVNGPPNRIAMAAFNIQTERAAQT